MSLRLSNITNFIYKFLTFRKIFKASFLKPLDKITSKKILFNSKANFFDKTEFIATTPPNALTGSHTKAF